MSLDPLSPVLPPHPALSEWYGAAPSKRRFLRSIFDDTAHDYDHVERLLSWGQGSRYRRDALERAGLSAGQKVLDVAAGTGLVAREEVTLVGDSRLVIGLDPSAGMLRQAVDALKIAAVLGTGEQIPFADRQFDFLSMGFALRHLADLRRGVFRVLPRAPSRRPVVHPGNYRPPRPAEARPAPRVHAGGHPDTDAVHDERPVVATALAVLLGHH